MSKKKSSYPRHRLLVYQHITREFRGMPFMIIAMCVILWVLAWLGSINALPGADTGLLRNLWEGQWLIAVAILACGGLYIASLWISRVSVVEVRPKALYVQAGLLAVNFSYKRIRQIRLVEMGAHHQSKHLSGSDAGIADDLAGLSCTGVDLASWPWPGRDNLQRLWSRFMFTQDGEGLMLAVKDAMSLNRQLDERVTAALEKSQARSAYADPIERAAQMNQGR
jgi:hypothetical protein